MRFLLGFTLSNCVKASLNQLYLEDTNPSKYTGKVPSDLNILLQFSRGLQHIHKYLIHGDVKPDNVLIAEEQGHARIKVGDFGFSKPVTISGFCQVDKIPGSPLWMAPELLRARDQPASRYGNRVMVKSDVFSAGCVFFYVVTKGLHPFDSDTRNIELGEPVRLESNSLSLLWNQPVI